MSSTRFARRWKRRPARPATSDRGGPNRAGRLTVFWHCGAKDFAVRSAAPAVCNKASTLLIEISADSEQAQMIRVRPSAETETAAAAALEHARAASRVLAGLLLLSCP